MAKKLTFTLTATLPDDAMDQAEVIAKLKAPRDAFVAALKDAGLEHEHETKVMTAKAPSDKPRKKRGQLAAAAG